ncbi:MAG: protein translocase subunit SecDF [Rhizobiaceae bacterium]|nr:protein translocase subunit SecDF [Rhizobiaceae bacterium]
MLYFSTWKTVLIWLVVAVGAVFAAPNLYSPGFRETLPDAVPSRPMTLGLDLQGGSHLLLQVDRESLVEDRLATLRDDARNALRGEQIGYTDLAIRGERDVVLTLRDPAEEQAMRDALADLIAPVTGGLFGAGAVTEVELTVENGTDVTLGLTEEGITNRLSSAVTQSIEVINRRVNELGTTEPTIQRQGTDRILVQVPGLDDPQRLKDILGKTAKLTFQFVDRTMPVEEALTGRPPAGTAVLYSNDDPPVAYIIENRVIVSGENLSDAQAGYDQRTSEPIVSFRFDTKGAQRFGQATQQGVGREFAIVLDNEVISAPVIREPILGGSGQISGNFTVESANDLAVLLRAGALPADLTIIEERTVGPGLGADSVNAGVFASIIASILVVTFMLVAYGLLGVIANVALIANVVLIIAILSALGATLTLPGIAGIVLTVGMAVDSNVIIFERVREERRMGRSFIQSMDEGFQKGIATVVDANLTTLIAAVVLFFLGSGPVKGFAVTLAIGIVTTVFTAFTLTRWMIALWIRRSKPKDLPWGLKLVPDNTKLGFMRLRNWAFAFSILTTIGTFVALAVTDLNYGIDFRGGSMIEVQSKAEVADVGAIRGALSDLNLGDVQVQEFGSPRDVLIRIESQDDSEAGQQAAIANVRAALEADYEVRRVEVVGPTVSGELTRNGIIGVTVAMLLILIYIWVRFEWQFAVGAILATGHDVIMTVGLFAFTGLEFNLTSIAAVLTIMGYSINDTVVVYDRVRENLRKFKKMPITELLDLSVNQTLSRTVLTGMTTLFALIALWLFGGEVIRAFVFAMIFGIVIGTYSSVFVAGPLLILFRLRAETFEAETSGAPSGQPAPKQA